MAITVVGVNNAAGQNAGAAASGVAAIAATLPAGSANGDRIFVYRAHTRNAATVNTGWTSLLQNGLAITIGTLGEQLGPRQICVYWRDYDGVWTMPTFQASVANAENSHWLGAVALRPTAGSAFDAPSISSIAEYTGSTVSTLPFTNLAGLTNLTGNVMMLGVASSTVAAFGGAAAAQSGTTFGTHTERCDGEATLGYNVAGALYTVPITVGGGSNNMNVNVTRTPAGRGSLVAWSQSETVIPPADTGNFFQMF